MAVKSFKPTSAGRRWMTVADFSGLTKKKPEKNLTEHAPKHAGRNNYGSITAYHLGGGHKRRYRLIDFKRDKTGVPARVAALEYDPNRSAYIALLHYADGEKRYILAPNGIEVGARLLSSANAEIRVGNTLPLEKIPLGTTIHNIELKIGKGGQLCRSAGTAAQLMAKEGEYAQVRLPSGETRMIHLRCKATVGQVGNIEHESITIGTAGRARWLGRRPINRGVSMNPVDHPMGGGEGKSSGGRHPVTPWGIPTKGYKTRNNRRTDRFIVKRRG